MVPGVSFTVLENAAASAGADAHRPVDDDVLAVFLCPGGAHLAQEAGENARGSATVGAMDDDDGLMRERDARVFMRDCGVLPADDLARIDGGESFAAEFQRSFQAGKVIDHADRSCADGNLNDGRKPLQLFVAERCVAGGEGPVAVAQIVDSGAAAGGAIVHLHGVGLLVVLAPAVDQRLNCRAAGGGDGAYLRRLNLGFSLLSLFGQVAASCEEKQKWKKPRPP